VTFELYGANESIDGLDTLIAAQALFEGRELARKSPLQFTGLAAKVGQNMMPCRN
jgi:hypothetical protein